MIADIILIIAGTVIYIIGGISQGIGFIMPQSWSDSLQQMFATLAPWQWVFPVDTLLTDLTLFLVALGIYMGFRYGLWSLSWLPWIHPQPLPTIPQKNVLDLRPDKNDYRYGRTIDLRHAKKIQPKGRTMKDIY